MSRRSAPQDPASGHTDSAGLRLHAPASSMAGRGDLEWAGWLFQSVRAQCHALVFQTEAVERAEALADWGRFAARFFLPVIAPALLLGWDAARRGDDAALTACDRDLGPRLAPDGAQRSLAGGSILLERTRGAKCQGALGRFRQGVEAGRSPGHLAAVWSGIGALFQLPPIDLLSEYLREEWTTAAQRCPHHELPQGPLSFSGLAHRALHEAGVFDGTVAGAS